MSKARNFFVIIFILAITTIASASVREQMAEAVKYYLTAHRSEWSGCRIEIEFPYAKETFERLESKKADNMYFNVAKNYQAPNITPRAILPISIFVDGIEQDRINLFVKANVYKDILVSSQKIMKGDPLSSTNVRLEEREISMVPSNYFTDEEKVSGQVAQYLIREGAAIFDWMVRTLPDVARGDTVKIIVESPGVRVVASGRAMEEGKIGDRIKVKREDVKSYLEATVISSGEVEVRI
ncbi:MAG: flagellar basal body P-ring formation chaperone FlgA [Candidatus Margulisiibacteriota bacterium]|nr:flagellar basal body P-ring formation chaperone FlgA [Candidatus Margulisiibacteriota bacterium]